MRAVAGALILGMVACTASTEDATTTEAPPTNGGPASVSTASGQTTSGWVEVASMTVARSEHPGVVLEGEIVIMGGLVEVGLGRTGVTAGVEAYSPAGDSWRELPDLPEPRHHGMAVVADDRLLMFGGYDASGSAVDTVWELTDDGWIERMSLPGPVAAGAAVVVDDLVYVVGGVPDPGLNRYDPTADSWTMLPAPEQEREHVAAVAVDGEIWAIAGRWQGEIRNSTEIFDAETETWRHGPSLIEARSGFGAATVGNLIVVAGGEVFSPDTALDSVEQLDRGDAEWSLIDPLPHGLHGNPLVAIGTDVYLPGGSVQPAGVDNDGRAFRLGLG